MVDLLNYGLVYRLGFVEYSWEYGIFAVRIGSAANVQIALMYALLIITGYLLGGLNAGIIISKLAFRDDIRNHGSGGAGATNMLRTYGKPAAAVTFMLDGIKTVIAVFIGVIMFGNHFNVVGMFAGPYIGGLAAIVGHAFPVYYKFKGGKSVAATFFMVLLTSPITALICLLIFVIIVKWTKYVSLGSVMAVMVYPMILNRFTGVGTHNLIAIIVMFLVIFLHRGNIKRLRLGEENKINLRKKKNGIDSMPENNQLENKEDEEK